MKYDLAIIGGGPAGAAAAVYAARKKLCSAIITADWGGQSTESPEVQNWLGTVAISGFDLAKTFKNHVEAYKGESLTMIEGDRAKLITKSEDGFLTETERGQKIESRAILIATGSRRRRLNIPGAQEFENKGITYCASCDGPLFAGKEVAVIGGGNAGFESAAQLLAYCSKVTLLHRHNNFKADPITVEKVKENPKAVLVTDVEPTKVEGETLVGSLTYKDLKSGEETTIPVSGIFVEIGALPNTDFAKDLVKTNEIGSIITDPRNQRTNQEGIWAAGDCTDGLYHQNNIAAGDAVKALEDIYIYLHGR